MSDCRVTKFCLVWLLHGWCHVKLLLSWHTFCVHHAPILLKATHTWGACVFSCNLTPARLSESPGFLCATAKTQGWTEHRNKSRHKTLTGEKKILPLVMPGASNLRPDYKSKTLPLSYKSPPQGNAHSHYHRTPITAAAQVSKQLWLGGTGVLESEHQNTKLLRQGSGKVRWRGGDNSVGRASDREARCNTDRFESLVWEWIFLSHTGVEIDFSLRHRFESLSLIHISEPTRPP